MQEYRVSPRTSTQHDAKPQILRTGDGRTIAEDAEDLDFLHFLGWAAGRPDPELSEYQFGVTNPLFFCTRTYPEFQTYLKNSGEMLFVRHDRMPNHKLEISGPHPQSYLFWRLHGAQQSTESDATDSVDTVVSKPLSVWVSRDLHRQIETDLQLEDSTVRRCSTWPVNRTFLYVDISDFSKQSAIHQALIINSLASLTQPKHWKSGHEPTALGNIETQLCIGDGYIYCFTDSAWAVYFAARLAKKIEGLVARREIVEFHFRMGVHVGPVYRFWDSRRGQGDWNYIGDGINGGNRVLAAIGKDADDLVFVSFETIRRIREGNPKSPVRSMLLHSLLNRGRRKDKHDRMWRVYEVNHTIVMASSVRKARNRV